MNSILLSAPIHFEKAMGIIATLTEISRHECDHEKRETDDENACNPESSLWNSAFASAVMYLD